MKFRLKQLVDSMGALQGLSNKEFTPKVGYKIAKIINKMKPEFEAYEKIKNDLVKKYGEKGANGAMGIDPQNNKAGYDKFLEELKTILDEDVEIVFNASGNDITKIPMADLCDSTGMQIDIPPVWLVPLMDWLIEDEEEI